MKLRLSLHQTFTIWGLLLSYVVATPCMASSSMVSDIYKYNLTDWQRTERLMTMLRKQHRLPRHSLNMIEGDLHFNRGEYFHALKFYKRAIYDERIKDSCVWRSKLLVRIIPCY